MPNFKRTHFLKCSLVVLCFASMAIFKIPVVRAETPVAVEPQQSEHKFQECNSAYDKIPLAPKETSKKLKKTLEKGLLFYSPEQYVVDYHNYKIATAPGCSDQAAAKQIRNELAYGVKGDIDLLFKKEFEGLFGRENGTLVTVDTLTFGFGAASTIATRAAAKTIYSALGTAFSGIGLSVYKNYYGQQAFQIIGVAMETRRNKLGAAIERKLTSEDTLSYPITSALADLTDYMRAGTLPAGLSELQEEAAAANSGTHQEGALSTPASPSVHLAGGSKEISLGWTAVSGAASYSVYWSDKSPVTTKSNKVSGITASYYIDHSVGVNAQRFYAVSAVNTAGESKLSTQLSSTTLNPPSPLPTKIEAPSVVPIPGDSQVTLIWPGIVGADSYTVIFSENEDMTNPGNVLTSEDNLINVNGLVNGKQYFFKVTAKSSRPDVHDATSNTPVSATPAKAQ